MGPQFNFVNWGRVTRQAGGKEGQKSSRGKLQKIFLPSDLQIHVQIQKRHQLIQFNLIRLCCIFFNEVLNHFNSRSTIVSANSEFRIDRRYMCNKDGTLFPGFGRRAQFMLQNDPHAKKPLSLRCPLQHSPPLIAVSSSPPPPLHPRKGAVALPRSQCTQQKRRRRHLIALLYGAFYSCVHCAAHNYSGGTRGPLCILSLRNK